MECRPPLPPFNLETAVQKVRAAKDGWNNRDPQKEGLGFNPVHTALATKMIAFSISP